MSQYTTQAQEPAENARLQNQTSVNPRVTERKTAATRRTVLGGVGVLVASVVGTGSSTATTSAPAGYGDGGYGAEGFGGGAE